jgi:hypothetical protein
VAAGKLQTVLHCTVIGESDESEESQMWNFQHNKVWSRSLGMAFLLGLFMFLAGCGREQAATNTALALTSVNPNSGAQGAGVPVTLTGLGFASGATINVPAAAGITVSGATVVSSTQITATFTMAANAPPNIAQNVTVTSAGATTNAQTFTVTGTAPRVSATTPLNLFDCVPINRTITAAFTKAMTPLTTANFLVTGAIPVTGTVTYDAVNNIAIFTPTSNLGPDSLYQATITTSAKDTTGNPLASNFSWSFESCVTASTTAPSVTATVPVSAATLVPINQIITAQFSEGMNSTTLTAATFTLKGPGATAVAGTVLYTGNAGAIATFTPTSPLTASTTYTATITAGAKDPSGNALVSGPVPNPWTFVTGTAANVTAPTVTLTVPANAATGVAINQAVNATFSKAMNPLTISTATFTLVTGGAPVTGTVSYDVPSQVATFTPSSTLTPGAAYTATISTGVQDLSGNALVSGTVPNPWTFTIATPAVVGPAPPSLGSAATFGAAGGAAGMTNSGILTVVNGDIATTGASTTVTGFHDTTVLPYIQFTAGCIYTETTLNVGTVNGAIYTATPPPAPSSLGCPNEGTAATAAIATKALADANAAFIATSPANMPPTVAAQGGELGTLTLPPGVYQSAPGTFGITTGNLTLDAQGNANAVWVFQMGSSLTVGVAGNPRSVILINGAQAKNVFWHVGSAATINAAGGGTMVGTIIATAGVTFSTAGNTTITTLNGRALGLVASVTLVNTVINVPLP